MSIRFWAVVVFVILLIQATDVVAGYSGTHIQTTLDKEALGSIPGGSMGNTPVTDSVTITITNMTSVQWTDYEIFFSTPMGGGMNQPIVLQITDPTSTVFTHQAFIGSTELDLTRGMLDAPNSFQVTFNLTHNNSVDIMGSPSYDVAGVPEPASVVMLVFGLGSAGGVALIRHKRPG